MSLLAADNDGITGEVRLMEMIMRCCCGKKDIDEPIFVNDYRHEPYGPVGNFCGPSYKHDIRDLKAEVERLRVFADEAMAAMDCAQANIRGHDCMVDEITLGMLDDAMDMNPLGWEPTKKE